MGKHASGSDRPASRGFIVVTVLWILAALATLAAVYAAYVNVTAFGMSEYDERLQAQELAAAGIELAVFQITAPPTEHPSHGRIDFRLGNRAVTAEFRAENGRVDLNFASKELLTRVFIASGANRDAAESYADRVIAWRSPRNSGKADEDAALYRSGYAPRAGPFQHIYEVALVKGIPPEMIDSALQNLTVYSGQSEINALSASPDVLATLPGLTPERVETLVAQRATASQDIVNAQLGAAAQYVTFLAGKTDRVIVSVPIKANRRLVVEAVLLLPDSGPEPYRVLSWSERLE